MYRALMSEDVTQFLKINLKADTIQSVNQVHQIYIHLPSISSLNQPISIAQLYSAANEIGTEVTKCNAHKLIHPIINDQNQPNSTMDIINSGLETEQPIRVNFSL